MKVMAFSTKGYDRPYLEKEAGTKHDFSFTEKRLTLETASLAAGYDSVALFTSDDASRPVLTKLHQLGVRFIALRSAGYDHVDLQAATALGMSVANAPDYSPYSIAEHAVAMLLAVNRKIVESQLLMQMQDFRLDTLTGFDIHGKKVGIIGTGKIGMAFARIMKGFGAIVLAYDPVKNPDAVQVGVRYVSFDEILRNADVISIHCPLNETTRNMFSKYQFDRMRTGAILINTSRGGIVNTGDLIDALEKGILGAACLDVYDKEKGLFFEDHRRSILRDVNFARLRSFRNVLITGHQAFLTHEALTGICRTTMANLDAWEDASASPNDLTPFSYPAGMLPVRNTDIKLSA